MNAPGTQCFARSETPDANSETGNESMQPEGNPKVRATIYLPLKVLNEARDAAVHLAGYPARLTLTQLAENALRAELRRLKALYNDGQDFPRRDEELRGGRPIAA